MEEATPARLTAVEASKLPGVALKNGVCSLQSARDATAGHFFVTRNALLRHSRETKYKDVRGGNNWEVKVFTAPVPLLLG